MTVIASKTPAARFRRSAGKASFAVITSNTANGRIKVSAGMKSFAMLSLGTKWLESLMGVLVWENLLRYH